MPIAPQSQLKSRPSKHRGPNPPRSRAPDTADYWDRLPRAARSRSRIQRSGKGVSKAAPERADSSHTITHYAQTVRGSNILVLVGGVPLNTNRDLARNLATSTRPTSKKSKCCVAAVPPTAPTLSGIVSVTTLQHGAEPHAETAFSMTPLPHLGSLGLGGAVQQFFAVITASSNTNSMSTATIQQVIRRARQQHRPGHAGLEGVRQELDDHNAARSGWPLEDPVGRGLQQERSDTPDDLFFLFTYDPTVDSSIARPER